MSDGVQFNWNVFPSTRLENSQLPTPLGCLYKPLVKLDSSENNPCSFCSCPKCGAYMNPYVEVDNIKKTWKCQFCLQKSYLPKNISLIPTNAFVEQLLPADISNGKQDEVPEVIIFIVDSYQHLDEFREGQSQVAQDLGQEKSSFETLVGKLSTAMDKLRDGTLVGIVTFDKDVHFHRQGGSTISFGNEELFKQDKYDVSELFKDSGSIVKSILQKVGGSTTTSNPLSLTESSILVNNGLLSALTPESRPLIKEYISALRPSFTNSYKPLRSFGLCLYITSIILNKLSFQNFNGKIMTFLSGPNTSQPGIVLNTNNTNNFRLHNDIRQLNNFDFNTSQRFYETLSYIANGLPINTAFQVGYDQTKKTTDFELNQLSPKWSIDIFTGSLDQVGLYELKKLILNVNGDMFTTNSFKDLQFVLQFEKAIESIINSQLMHNASLTVLTSPRLKIKSLLGHCHRLPSSFKDSELHYDKISDQLTKFESKYNRNYFTNRWFWNTLKPSDTVSIFFEVDGLKSYSDRKLLNEFFIQFQLKYWDLVSKTWKLRILTRLQPTTAYSPKLDLNMNLLNSKIEMLQNFNASSWTILLSRLLINKLDTNIGFEFEGILEFIDTIVVKLLNNFNRLIVENYTINENLKTLPSLVYNLRKNPQLINIFNSSPDETTFYHHWFMKFDENLSSRVIEPRLFKYQTETLVIPVSMDSDIIDKIPSKSYLIMDSIFHNIIYYKYTNQEDRLSLHHSNNESKQSSLEPWSFIQDLIKGRPLDPKYIITQTNHSQARYLVARLNPVHVETYIPEAPAITTISTKSSWFLNWFSKEVDKPTLKSNILSDEACFQQYYDDLLQKVKAYKVEDDY